MKTISFRLDPKDIQKAITEIQREYYTKLPEKVKKLEMSLAEVGKAKIEEKFGNGEYQIDIYRRSNGTNIRVTGERVVFLEYGTGFLTDSSHPYAGEIPIKVAPGTWSAEHARTYQDYVAKHKDDDPTGRNYRYNHKPRYGMLEAFIAMKDSVLSKAREIFAK